MACCRRCAFFKATSGYPYCPFSVCIREQFPEFDKRREPECGV